MQTSKRIKCKAKYYVSKCNEMEIEPVLFSLGSNVLHLKKKNSFVFVKLFLDKY